MNNNYLDLSIVKNYIIDNMIDTMYASIFDINNSNNNVLSRLNTNADNAYTISVFTLFYFLIHSSKLNDNIVIPIKIIPSYYNINSININDNIFYIKNNINSYVSSKIFNYTLEKPDIFKFIALNTENCNYELIFTNNYIYKNNLIFNLSFSNDKEFSNFDTNKYLIDNNILNKSKQLEITYKHFIYFSIVV